jgi:small-conductance mechanosensitive channel
LGLVLAFFIARQMAITAGKIPAHENTVFYKLKHNVYVNFYELCFFFFLFIAFAMEQAAYNAMGINDWLVTTITVLIALWVLMRLSMSLGKHSYKARLITFGLWTVFLLSLFRSSSSEFGFFRSKLFSLGKIDISLLFVMETVVIFALLMWTAQFVFQLIKKWIDSSKTLSSSHKLLYKQVSRFALYVLAIIVGLSIIGFDLTLLGIFSGTLGFGVGMGLSRLIANFFSGIVLLMDKSIRPGDILQVEGVRGKVDQMNARYVSVITRDGHNILVPNESLMNEKVHNLSYSSTNLQSHMFFSVVYGSDVLFVKKIVEVLVNETPGVLKYPPAYCFVCELTDNNIKFEIKYWIDDAITSNSLLTHTLLVSLMDTLKKNGVELYVKKSKNDKPEPKKVKKKVVSKK